ncbi:hypothetical protein [Cohnella boryungensis]|uniref:ATP-binding protein n=1 Tax=Cohnella boryungensis TaxID=768479 RepID=A0ABV8SHX3_9BACL
MKDVRSEYSIRTITKNMIEDFSKVSKGLLEVTNNEMYVVNSEKAVYGKVYGKPSNRLSSLLSIDREVLILFSGYSRQQMRTINTVGTIVKSSNGRLEPTVAIVVHCDNQGNSKLKKWGREHGISVLPVYYHKDKFPKTQEEFENILCRELFSYDSFDIVGPVSDDEHFYGRRTEAQDLARQLQIGQIKCCLGIRKVGKTSIVNRIVDVCREHHDCYLVVVDCSNDSIWSMRSHELMFSLAQTLRGIKGTQEGYSTLITCNEDSNMVTASQFLASEVADSDKPIIFVFDEIDYITPSSPTTKLWVHDFNEFWRNFRVLYQESARISKRFSILISGVSSKWFRVESIEGVENAALAFVPEEYLLPLPRGASIAMIRDLARVSGLQFDEINGDPIASFCCDIPYWIRKACSFIHRRIDIQMRPIKPDVQTIKIHLEEFIEAEGSIIAQAALTHLFRVYPDLKNHAMECLKGNIESLPKSYINILTKYGLLKKQGEIYKLSGEMFQEGLALIHEESDMVGEKVEPDHIFVSETIAEENEINKNLLEEWSDELALIGKRRNILEKKLRGIVLNFLRYDSLMDKQKPPVNERILKRIEEKKRKVFASIPPDEFMEKLLWTELVTIIDKEWSVFERLFSDKSQFSLNSSIINERFDAHAKDADSADLALYRRSLSWYEDKIRGA